ncbi:hypothetical protein J2Z53_001365 [Clostridium moniliforme]|uniref:Uncharacterized protein n=1 Tax=Clostridium moniliforme TaxID=39489 RepID=A0ABS4F0K5_9CLOT|nr:hypothetical protein [Clostridium moniliforme]MBP1889782.1 hypothetical protein [Clostridium moniliforme]
MKVKVYEQDTKIEVITDYSTKFIRKAKNLSGKWNKSKSLWEFDIKNKKYVLDALQKIFYENDTEKIERVDVIVDLQKYLKEKNKKNFGNAIEIFNRSAGTRFNRDSQVKLNNDCIIVEGDFCEWGGSIRHPQIGDVEGVILKMNNIPKKQVEEEIKKYNLTCMTIIEEDQIRE